nr:unnamed protein product [Callosobruchus analis]
MAQDGFLPYPEGFATDAIHHVHDPEKWKSKSLAPLIETSANYKHSAPGVFEGDKYTVSEILPSFRIETTFADSTDLSNLEKAIEPSTKLIWVETLTNPTTKITDIKGAAAITKNHHITLAVDNTILTPYLHRPLDLGPIWIPSHRQHELFKKQTSDDSGRFSMVLRSGLKESEAFLRAVKVFTLAGSLGGYQNPKRPTLQSNRKRENSLDFLKNLIRLSIGLEDPEHLIADIDQALNRMEE